MMRTIRLLALLCLLLAIPGGLGHASAQTPAAGLNWVAVSPGRRRRGDAGRRG